MAKCTSSLFYKLKTQHIKYIYIYLWLLFSSCTPEIEIPKENCKASDWMVNSSFEEVISFYQFGRSSPFPENTIIEGQVISSDQFGEFYKTLIVQDFSESNTDGLRFNLGRSDLYLDFQIGDKIRIKLDDLGVHRNFGSLEIGLYQQGQIREIPEDLWRNHFQKLCLNTPLISELNPEVFRSNTLVSFDNIVLDTTKSMGFDSNQTREHPLLRMLDCTFPLEILNLEVNAYNDFKNRKFPFKWTRITGVISEKYGQKNLILRSEKDLEFQDSPCGEIQSSNLILEDLLQQTNQGIQLVSSEINMVLRLVVIANDRTKNYSKELVLSPSNGTVGISVLVNMEDLYKDFEIGREVLLNLKSLYLQRNNNFLRIGIWSREGIAPIEPENIHKYLFPLTSMSDVESYDIPLEELEKKNYENRLIRFKNYQLREEELGLAFAFFSGTESGDRNFLQCDSGESLLLRTSGEANFAHQKIPFGDLELSGIYQLGVFKIQNLEDLKVVGERKECFKEKKQVFFSQIADPLNDYRARYISLYNASEQSVSLSGWVLQRYINGNTYPSGNGVDLSELTIDADAYVVISNRDLNRYYNRSSDLVSATVSGNGNDVYALYDNFGDIVDVYGTIGENGENTSWDYSDALARRIAIGSSQFSSVEWEYFRSFVVPDEINPWVGNLSIKFD